MVTHRVSRQSHDLSSMNAEMSGRVCSARQRATRVRRHRWKHKQRMTLTPSDFHFLNQNVLAGAILFFWNQYSNIVRTKLLSTALTVRVIIKK